MTAIRILGAAISGIVMLMTALPAQASTYNVVGNGVTLDFTATITTDPFNLITGMTGFVNGSDPIVGTIAPDTAPFTTFWTSWDNKFDGEAATPVTNGGVLFRTIANLVVNLYASGENIFASFAPPITQADYNPGTSMSLTIQDQSNMSAVPAPASLPLFLSVIAGLIILGRRKMNRQKRSLFPAEA